MPTIIYATIFTTLLGLGIGLCITTNSYYTKAERIQLIIGTVLIGFAVGALFGGMVVFAD